VFRDPIYFNKIPPLSHIAVCVIVTAVALFIGALAFRRASDRIAFYI
jgi:ABC-type polysaccharide/polyol phosphate export permease